MTKSELRKPTPVWLTRTKLIFGVVFAYSALDFGLVAEMDIRRTLHNYVMRAHPWSALITTAITLFFFVSCVALLLSVRTNDAWRNSKIVTGRKVHSYVLAVLSLGLYAISLCLPAYSDTGRSTLGFEAAAFGAFSIFGLYPVWLANPLLQVAWLGWIWRDQKLALAASLLALLLALYFIVHPMVMGWDVAPYEGRPGYFKLESGFLAWILSIFSFALVASIDFFACRRLTEQR